MSRPFLFSKQTSKYLVEFKAGKMTMKGTTVFPVKRQGLVYLNQSDDNLMHFCWKDRQTGQTEDDLIVFPEDAEFKRVPQCTTGRVYVLIFKSSSRRCFYWMQDANDEKDEEYCNKVNEYLNNPPAHGCRSGNSSSTSGLSSSLGAALGNLGGLADLGSIREGDLHNLLNNMNPQQLVQIMGDMQNSSIINLGGSSNGSSVDISRNRRPAQPSTTNQSESSSNAKSASNTRAAVPTAPSSSQPPIQLSDLESIISGLTVPAKDQQQDKNAIANYLSSSIKSDALQALLANEQFLKGVKEILPATDLSDNPEKEAPISEQLSSTVNSPQFHQALKKFTLAFQSGQLGPLLRQFGLGPACVDAANNGDLEAFLKAIEEEEKNKKKSTQKKEDDNEMALD